MTYSQPGSPPAPPPGGWPWPDQDADLAAELDAVLALLDEPADDEFDPPDDTSPLWGLTRAPRTG